MYYYSMYGSACGRRRMEESDWCDRLFDGGRWFANWNVNTPSEYCSAGTIPAGERGGRRGAAENQTRPHRSADGGSECWVVGTGRMLHARSGPGWMPSMLLGSRCVPASSKRSRLFCFSLSLSLSRSTVTHSPEQNAHADNEEEWEK